jgi:serine/threonine protein kinase
LPSRLSRSNVLSLNGFRHGLDEDDQLALQNEVDILSQIDHPNVLKLFEIFEEDYFMYLVMELMEGGEVRFSNPSYLTGS